MNVGVCIWFDSAFVAPRSQRPPPPHTHWVQRGKSAHYSKRRSRTSENAESIHSQRSEWCIEDSKVTAVGCSDLRIWPKESERTERNKRSNGEVNGKKGTVQSAHTNYLHN